MQERPARPIGRPKGTGSQTIYEVVRRRILSLEMPPASGIDETALVGEFGISRTPVREALIRLATDGYVTLLPNRGASVSPLDIKEIPELLEAMELCLRVTSRWAAIRRTEADLKSMWDQQAVLDEASANDDYFAMSEANSGLHRAIAIAAGNRHMTSLYESLLPQYHRLTLSLLSTASRWTEHYKNYFADLHEEHQGLIEAIEKRDSDGAETRAQKHARQIGVRLEAYIWSAFSNPIKLADPKRRQGIDDPARRTRAKQRAGRS
jgi:DNA-binding GntR family transcriptional regulator